MLVLEWKGWNSYLGLWVDTLPCEGEDLDLTGGQALFGHDGVGVDVDELVLEVVDVVVRTGTGVLMKEWWKSEEGRWKKTRKYEPYMLGNSSEQAALKRFKFYFCVTLCSCGER